ncbi:GLPGLI family protein [Nemorincola caseinilytica]|uniref:GLPGLI family protein n=1 Tax=Nemorincola caseinilytica TaxID=2054315 RepID=A0ABP8NA06_9BACT
MKKTLLFIYTLLALAVSAGAQHTYKGRIEYERKVNMHAQMEEMEQMGNNSWVEKLKAQMPKFNSSYFDMLFDAGHTLYKPGRELPDNNPFKMFGGGPATDNIVLTEFSKNLVRANKNVFDQKFFVEDTIRVMDWKERDEVRTIAGYKCHKAVGRICDTVYVVAFYTEDIPVSGGPEMFGGLPGMIMELAIPRLHTTWVANKVELIPPKTEDFTIQEKGKKVNEQQLHDTIYDSFKKWGSMANRNVWWVVL